MQTPPRIHVNVKIPAQTMLRVDAIRDAENADVPLSSTRSSVICRALGWGLATLEARLPKKETTP